MSRPLPITLLVATGLIAALTLMASGAYAWHGSPAPYVDIEKTQAALKQIGTDGYSIDVEIAAMQGNAAQVEAVNRVNRARRIAGKLAKFRHLGKLTPGGLAAGVAIEIGWHLTGGFGNKHQTLTVTGVGNNTTYTVGTATAKRDDWCWYQPNGSSPSGCGDNPQGAVTSYPGCTDGCFLLVTRLNGSAMSPTWGGPATSDAIVALTAALTQGVTVGHFYDTAPSGDGVIMRIATEDELMAATTFGVPLPYTNQSVTHTYSGSPDPDYTDGSATDSAVETELTGGPPEVDLRVGEIVDPAYEGESFTWPAAAQLETYSQYLARLQAAGWLGTATVVRLGSDDSDHEFGSDGVPCTSAVPGAQIGTGTAVTFYQNASSIGNDEAGTGITCGGITVGPDECGFNKPQRWEPLTAVGAPNKEFYEAACAEAWAWLRANGWLSPAGVLNQQVIDDAVLNRNASLMGDARLPQALAPPGSGLTLSDWEKVFSLSFDDAPRKFHLHFYRRTNKSEAKEIKIRFNQFFEP